MATDAARLSGEKPALQARLEGLISDLVELAAGLLGGGALLYLAWNWGLTAAFTFLKPLSDFWMGPMVAGGLYFAVVVVKAVWKDDIAINLDDVEALIAKYAPLAGLVAAFWAVHHYLV